MERDVLTKWEHLMDSQSEALTLHEDAFYQHFRPYRHPETRRNIWGGIGLETFGSDFELVRTLEWDYVWTVVDGENSDQWITPGIRYVNRVCYLVTEVPHSGLEIDFRCPHRVTSLTPLGLKRQLNKVLKATMFAG